MKLETFFEKFDQFADAPDAVAKMRGLILRLAMQGDLSESHKTDGPVSELLREVDKDQMRLGLESSSRATSGNSDFSDDETADVTPARWAWVRFGNIARHNAGKTLDKGRNRGELRDYITTSNLYWGFFQLDAVRQMPMLDDELERCTAIKGDLLICEGGEAGRAAVWPHAREISFQNHVHRARFFAGINPYFVQRYLEKLNATGEIEKYRKGVGISNMSGKALASIPIPLPPLAEQKRIVAKVDELMALCDRLEAQQQERETRHAALARASLARFADAPTPANLPFLFHPSYAISPADLRKSILTLAVQGKLVPQDPNDEPAEEFLATVRNAARESGYRGRSNSEDDSNPKFVAHVTDELPAGWSVCPLEDLFKFIDYRGRTPVRCSSGVRLITAKNVKKGFIANEPVEFIAQDVYPKWMTRGFPKKGDLLFVTEGHTMGFVGTLNFDFKYALAQRTIDLQPFCDGYGPFYLYYLLSEQFQTAVVSNTTGSAAQGVKAAKLKRIRVTIPPLAEQRRIVAKVEQLMALVDALETQLAASRATAENLLAAIVAELTEGTHASPAC